MSRTHAFSVDHAARFGIEEAVLIQSLAWWIEKNRAEDRHLDEQGLTWTYNTYEQMAEAFPYLTKDKIRRAVLSLVAQGVLLKRQGDRCVWLAFADESAFLSPERNGEIAKHPGKSAIRPPETDLPNGEIATTNGEIATTNGEIAIGSIYKGTVPNQLLTTVATEAPPPPKLTRGDEPLTDAEDLTVSDTQQIFFRYNGGTPGPSWTAHLRVVIQDLLDQGVTVIRRMVLAAAAQAKANYKATNTGTNPPFLDQLTEELEKLAPTVDAVLTGPRELTLARSISVEDEEREWAERQKRLQVRKGLSPEAEAFWAKRELALAAQGAAA